ncbi:hypothetical protein, conserved [Eimeria necatrix]|uniref:RING-type domain-containing protein n=1 Tax=Eimeria necatrix TaxID=51315 RepID=U6MIK6_9EIME|nr:hypothetical protein, conserved [Eimeria necatrix]CDJ63856.1 hypothetical protein, conserved [Eimeria necatrix]
MLRSPRSCDRDSGSGNSSRSRSNSRGQHSKHLCPAKASELSATEGEETAKTSDGASSRKSSTRCSSTSPRSQDRRVCAASMASGYGDGANSNDRCSSNSSAVRELIDLDSEEDDDCLFIGRRDAAPVAATDSEAERLLGVHHNGCPRRANDSGRSTPLPFDYSLRGAPSHQRHQQSPLLPIRLLPCSPRGAAETAEATTVEAAGGFRLSPTAASASSAPASAAATTVEGVSVDSSDDEPELCGFRAPTSARASVFAADQQQQRLQHETICDRDTAAFLWGEIGRDERSATRMSHRTFPPAAVTAEGHLAAAATNRAAAAPAMDEAVSGLRSTGLEPTDLLPYLVIPQGLPHQLQLLQHQQQVQQQLRHQQHPLAGTVRSQQNLAAGSAAATAAHRVVSRRRIRRTMLPWQRQLQRSATGSVVATATSGEAADGAFDQVLVSLQQQQLWAEMDLWQQPQQQRGTPLHVLQQLPTLPFKHRTSAPLTTAASATCCNSGERSSGSSSSGQVGEEDDKEKCAICLDSFVEAQIVRFLPCLHFFHVSCVDTWLQQSDVCPICKWPVQCTASPHTEAIS